MNNKGMFYTNVSDYETKEDMMNDFIALRMYDMAKDKEIERLHSIIKEVREYIEENQEEHKYTDKGGFTYTEGHFLRDSDALLEILDKADKVSNNENN